MKYSYFTEIEEVVKWTYGHSEGFYDKNNPDTATLDTLGTTGTANNIGKMKYLKKQMLKTSTLQNHCYVLMI